MNIDLRGKYVVVTGGSRGIGAACCRLFAMSGASVLVHCCSNVTAANSVLRDLESSKDREHFVVAADLGQ
ncbi:MAG: SDR family NAD(P)-dependent oxidoreductase, partial [Acidobacteriota bacterium]